MSEKTLRDGGPATIYLSTKVKLEAMRVAKERGMSLSEMIQRLLVKEISLKRGTAHLYERELK